MIPIYLNVHHHSPPPVYGYLSFNIGDTMTIFDEILKPKKPKLTQEQEEKINEEYLNGFISKAKELSKKKGEQDAINKYR